MKMKPFLPKAYYLASKEALEDWLLTNWRLQRFAAETYGKQLSELPRVDMLEMCARLLLNEVTLRNTLYTPDMWELRELELQYVAVGLRDRERTDGLSAIWAEVFQVSSDEGASAVDYLKLHFSMHAPYIISQYQVDLLRSNGFLVTPVAHPLLSAISNLKRGVE